MKRKAAKNNFFHSFWRGQRLLTHLHVGLHSETSAGACSLFLQNFVVLHRSFSQHKRYLSLDRNTDDWTADKAVGSDSILLDSVEEQLSYEARYVKLLFLGGFLSMKDMHQGDKYSLLSSKESVGPAKMQIRDYFWKCYGWLVNGRRSFLSLSQGQEDVLHQHGADHHLLAVDRQLSGALVFGCHGDQHQAAARHRPACKPVDRVFRRRRRSTEVKAVKVRRWSHRIRRIHAD